MKTTDHYSPTRHFIFAYAAFFGLISLVVGGILQLEPAEAGVRHGPQLQPVSLAGDDGNDPEVPGCESLTQGQRCLRGATCVNDANDRLWCCKYENGRCMTLLESSIAGEAVLVVRGFRVGEQVGELLPWDFIYEIDGEPILKSDTVTEILAAIRRAEELGYWRELEVLSGHRFTVKDVAPGVERGFLGYPALWIAHPLEHSTLSTGQYWHELDDQVEQIPFCP